MKKTLFLTILLGSFLSTVPVLADSFSIDQLFQAFSQLSSIRSLGLPDEMTQYLEIMQDALGSSFQNGDFNLEAVYGEMGFPDMADLESQIQEAYQDSQQMEQAEEGANEVTRAVTEEYSNTAFTSEGQEAIQQKQETVAQGIENVQNSADEAQSETVTQNVLKKMAAQNTQIALLSGTTATELTELNVKQDLANKNLVNISEGVDSQNLAYDAQLNASLSSSMNLFSQMTLRP